MPRRHSRRSRRNSKKNLKMKGGECPGSASAYVSDVTSLNGQQMSVQEAGTGIGSALAYNGGAVENYSDDSSSLKHSPFKGGKRRQKEQKEQQQEGGTGILTDLAVPAVLLVANRVMTKRSTSKKRRSFRKRR